MNVYLFNARDLTILFCVCWSAVAVNTQAGVFVNMDRKRPSFAKLLRKAFLTCFAPLLFAIVASSPLANEENQRISNSKWPEKKKCQSIS